MERDAKRVTSSCSKIHIVDKPLGATPLAALQTFRGIAGVPEDERMSYAGRLDPMASGLLLLLQGDACNEQGTLQNHEKVALFCLVCFGECLCRIDYGAGNIRFTHGNSCWDCRRIATIYWGW